MPDLNDRLRKRIDTKTNESALNRQLGLETLKRHARFNLATGRAVKNPDGSLSTVRSGSVEHPQLNKGKPTLIPFVYDGRVVDAKEAVERAIKSGRRFPAFNTNEEATAASKKISRQVIL